MKLTSEEIKQRILKILHRLGRPAGSSQIAELLRGWGVDLSERSIRIHLLQLDAEGWRKLTFRWGLFFFVLAVLNEVVWRTQTQDFWVAFKVWGVMPLTMAFALAQTPLILKHEIKPAKTDE